MAEQAVPAVPSHIFMTCIVHVCAWPTFQMFYVIDLSNVLSVRH